MVAEVPTGRQVTGVAGGEPGGGMAGQGFGQRGEGVRFELVVGIEVLDEGSARPSQRDVASDGRTGVGAVDVDVHPRVGGRPAGLQGVEDGGSCGGWAIHLHRPRPRGEGLGLGRRPRRGYESGVGGVDRGHHVDLDLHDRVCSSRPRRWGEAASVSRRDVGAVWFRFRGAGGGVPAT